MQKQKEEKVLLKCIVKDCNNKVLVTLKTLNIEDSAVQFFNMCYFHKKQFKNKIKEIKNHYTKNNLNNKFIKDISNNVVNKYKKMKE